MPQTDPIADAFGIPVTEGAEAQLTKAAEAEASGKKRNAEDLGQSYRPKPICQYFPQNVIQAHHTAETGPRGSGGGDGEALRKLMAAAKLRPRDATTYTSLARAVGRAVATKGAAASPSLKDFAIRSWKLAVQLAPARPSALRELAAALRAQGKEQAAERILARVAA